MGASPPPITAAPVVGSAVAPPLKFRLFVDFWNLQITLNERHSQQCERDGVPHTKIQIDWTKLPACLIDEAAKMVGVVGHT
jgi:hypothetical protein